MREILPWRVHPASLNIWHIAHNWLIALEGAATSIAGVS
jgi:hypothetical protein